VTTSVGDLLSAADALARQLVRRLAAGTSSAELDSVVAAWPALAASAVRLVDALPLPPDAETVRLRRALGGFAGRPLPHPRVDRPGPDSAAVEIAVRLGAAADLLVGVPRAATLQDVTAARQLRAAAMAPVHAVARVSAAAGRAGGLDLWVVNALRRIAEATDGSAVPVGQGWGRYADVAAVRSDDTALDAVVARWFRITTDALTPRLAVTGRSLLTAAGDCLILTAAAATTLTAAAELGQLDRTTARTALGPLAASHQAWRAVARWPAGVRLDGEHPGEQLAASRELRQRVTDLLRDGGDWRPAAALHQEVPLDQLLTTMRRTLHAVANVAVAHYEAMDALVRGPGRLWIAPAAMADRAERSRTILEHGRRGGFVPMPAHEPTARLLLDNARAALTSSVEATAALDRTAGLRGPSPDADPQQPERLQPRARRAHEEPIRLSALPADRMAPRP